MPSPPQLRSTQAEGNISPREGGNPRIEVWLSEPVEKIKGHAWPHHSPNFENGRLMDIAGTSDPHVVTIHFPSGQSYTTWSNSVAMDQQKGRLYHIQLVPLADRVTNQEALDTIERIAKELRVDTDFKFRSMLAQWRKETPSQTWASYEGQFQVEKDIDVRFEAKYASNAGNPSVDKGWYVVLKFEVLSFFPHLQQKP